MAQTESRIKLIFDGVATGVIGAAAAAKAAVAGVAGDKKLSKQFDDLNESLDKTSGKILTLAGKGSGFATLGAVIGGVAGQALVAAPAIIGFGAAFAAVKLGMDGIKKAAEQLKPSVDSLKKSISDNFQRQLTPVFAQLKGLIEGMRTPLLGMSTAISRVAGDLVDVVASESGIRRLHNAIAGMSSLIDASGPGLAAFVDGFLTLGERVEPSMEGLGEAIGSVFRQLGDALGSISADTAQRAVDGLSATIRGLGAVIGPLTTLLAGLGAAIGDSLGVVFTNLGQAITIMTPGFVELGAAAGDLLRAAAPLLPVIGQLAGEAFSALAGALRDITPLVRDFAAWAQANPGTISTVAAAVLGLAVAFKTLKAAMAVKAAIDAASLAIELMGTRAGVAATKVGGAGFAAALGKVGTLLKGAAIVGGLALAAEAMDKINVSAADGKPLTGFADNLHNIVGAGEQVASGDFAGIFADIGDEWDQLVSKFQSGESPIGAVWKRIATSFQTDFLDVFAALPGKIGSALSSLGSAIAAAATGAWNFLVTTAQSAVDSVVAFVTGLPGMIGSALSSLGASISAAASTAWTTLVTATQTAVDSTVAVVTDLPFKVGFALGSLAGIIASAAIAAWNFLVTATTTAVTATVAFVTGLPAQVGAALSALGSTIVSVATSAWAAFTSAVIAGATAAVNWVRSVPGMIVAALSALASTLANAATTAWNAFTSALRTAWNATLSFVRSIPGLIVGALSALAGQLSSSATTAGNSFTNGLRNAMNAAISFVRSIPGAIVSALGSLGGLLVGAGRSVIDGLLAGIKAGVAAMYSFVSGIAAGIAARKGPIQVDRKVLVPAGLALMAGLQSGMETGLAQVLGLASGAAGQIGTAMGGSLALSGPNPNAGVLQQLLSLQSQQSPIEVTVLLDGQPVRDIARTEVATSSRATRRTVGMGAGTTF